MKHSIQTTFTEQHKKIIRIHVQLGASTRLVDIEKSHASRQHFPYNLYVYL